MVQPDVWRQEMTIEDKVTAYRLWLEGMSLEEVGSLFGLTRQRMYQIFREPLEDGGRRRNGRNDVRKVVYPYIRDYINEREMTLHEFCMQASRYSGVRARTLREYLIGDKKPRTPAINAIVIYTGMDADTAFYRE